MSSENTMRITEPPAPERTRTTGRKDARPDDDDARGRIHLRRRLKALAAIAAKDSLLGAARRRAPYSWGSYGRERRALGSSRPSRGEPP